MLASWRHISVGGKLLIGFGLVALIYVASSVYTMAQISATNDMSRSVAEQHSPAWNAVMESQLELFRGRFWLEEAVGGDETITEEQIAGQWRAAGWYLQAVLGGGERNGVKYVPIDDQVIRDGLKTIAADLDRLAEMSHRRFEAHAGSAAETRAGSELDRSLDARFDAILNDLIALEGAISGEIEEDNRLVQEIFAAEQKKIVLALLLVLLVGTAIALVFSQHVVTRPIRRMTEFLEKIAEGRLTESVEVGSADELGLMAVAANTMVARLSTLVSQVQKSGIQVASSVTEIAASTKEQEATATEHAATTSEVAASVKEISATSMELGKTTEEVAQLAQETATSAADGQALITGLDSTMNRMSAASGTIAEKFAVLSEKTGNISNVVTTINKVAEQTNLLSLNAAIEAEKAGEYGRGFSVVATEIRRLADQTAVATYDIEQTVGEVQSAVSAGVMSMDKFTEEIQSSVDDARKAGERLERVTEQVQALAPHVESVNEGLQAQVDGASQINEAMSNLSEAAQQTADFVRQSNSAIADLHDAARGLKEGVSIFKLKDDAEPLTKSAQD